jgi:hypothetical protein
MTKITLMSVGAVGGSPPPPLQTSWTRAERACAAHHRGDTYYDLLADSSEPATGSASDTVGATSPLQPGFTLNL